MSHNNTPSNTTRVENETYRDFSLVRITDVPERLLDSQNKVYGFDAWKGSGLPNRDGSYQQSDTKFSYGNYAEYVVLATCVHKLGLEGQVEQSTRAEDSLGLDMKYVSPNGVTVRIDIKCNADPHETGFELSRKHKTIGGVETDELLYIDGEPVYTLRLNRLQVEKLRSANSDSCADLSFALAGLTEMTTNQQQTDGNVYIVAGNKVFGYKRIKNSDSIHIRGDQLR